MSSVQFMAPSSGNFYFWNKCQLKEKNSWGGSDYFLSEITEKPTTLGLVSLFFMVHL